MPSSQNTHLEPLGPEDLTLETERLRLTPFAAADLDLALEMFTDPEVMKYLWDLMTPKEAEESMAENVQRGAGGRIGIWCAADKTTGEKIGTGALLPLPIDLDDTDWSLVRPESYPDAEIEVGYVLKKTAWGKGYATEICTRLLAFAFMQTALDEVVATTDNDNAASQHVLTKCGLKLKGKRRCYADDNCPDFRIAKDEWLTRQQT